MANEDKNSILMWPKRVAQSIAFGAVEAVKEQMPAMFSTVENNKEAAKQIYQELLGSRQQLTKLKTIQDTYIFKPAKEIIKNIKSDLKSGVFYHPERAAKAEEDSTKAMMESLLKEAGMEDLMGMLSGDEELSETEVQDMPITPITEMTSGDAFVATTIAQEQRFATNSLAKVQSDIAEAQMHASRTMGNMQLRGMQRYTNITERGFEAMIQGFNNIGEFHNTVVFKHVENSTKYYETMTQLTQENNAILKEMVEMKRNQYKAAQDEADPNAAPNKTDLFKNGVFDLSTYIKLVESNLGGIEMLQMIPAMVQGFVAGIVANPMQFLTKQAVSVALGPGLRLAMRKFDRSLTGYISSGLAKLGDFGKDPSNGILGYIGKIFGISTDNIDINKTLIKDIKQPRSWDGEDHFYLTKVIPSYLSNIESALTGTEARIFNSTTGKFTTAAGIKKKFEQNETRLATGNAYELTESMKNIIHSNIDFGEDRDSIKRVNEALKQFAIGLQEKGKLDNVEEVLTDKTFGDNDNMRKILYSALVAAAEQDPGIIARVNDNIIQSKYAEHQRRSKGENLTDEEIFMASGMPNLFTNGGRAVTLGERVAPQNITQNPLFTSRADESATDSLISWQARIYKVLTEIRDNGIASSGGILDSIRSAIGNITGTNSDNTPPPAIPPEPTPPSPPEESPYGGRSVESMISLSADPLDPLNLAIKYKTLKDFYHSSDFRDNIDYWYSGNKPNGALKAVEQFILYRDKLDLVDNGYGQYDQTREYQNLRASGVQAGTLSDEETTTAALESNDEIADKMATHILSNKEKAAKLVQERQEMFERSWIEDMLLDNDGKLERDDKIRKYKGDPTKSILENIANATEIGDKIGLISTGIGEIANAPRSILTSVLHTADKMMYEFMFGRKTGDENEIQGLFGKMTSKMDEAGQTLNDSISKVADTIAKNQEKWLDQGLKFLKERFGLDVKGIYNKAKTTVKNFFKPVTDKATEASSSFISDITGAVKGTFNDIFGKKEQSDQETTSTETTTQEEQPTQRAFGIPSVDNRDGELAIVSKGESILYPKFNPFNTNRDSMPDVGSIGIPNISKTGLTYLPKGSAVIPSNINPWNPDREKARPEQDAINETRLQEKLEGHVPSYAVGIASSGETAAGVLSHILSDLDTEDLQGVLSLLAQHLNLKNQDDTTNILGELSGMGAKELADFIDLTPKNREFIEKIFKSLWKSKIARSNEQVRDFLRNAARAAGYTEKLETENELIYEDYNKQTGMINGASQFLMQMTGKDPEKALEETKKYIIHNTPEMMKGGMAGALAGTLFPLGGPIFGAIGGVVSSLLSNNKSFMNYVFGNEIGNGERDDTGLVSNKFMKSLQKYIPDIKKYGITGSLIGLITPFGPLGGLMAGIAASYVKNNEAAKKFLFGGDEDSKSGLFSRDLRNKIKKALPNIGAATLSALFLGPFGIAGNAVIGAGIGLLSTIEIFKKIMLGSKDRNGVRHGGLAGAIRRHITNPLKRNFKGWVKDIGKWFKRDLVRPISRAIGPIGKYLGNAIKDTTRDVLYAIQEKIAGPGSFFDKIFNQFFYGIKKAGGFGKWLTQGVIGGVGSLIGKSIGWLGDLAREKNYKKGNAGDETAAEVIENLKKMKSTDDRTYNMYQNIATLKHDYGMRTVNEDERMAKALAWAFGHEGTMAIKKKQSEAAGYLYSGINKATMENEKLENHHVHLMEFADELTKADSESAVTRTLENLKHYLKREKIVGNNYEDVMNMFYKNAEEIRLAKVAEQMREEGFESNQEGITHLKETYGFQDLSDEDFVNKHLSYLSKALTNESRLADKFKRESEAEQEELGNVPNSSIIEGADTEQSRAMEAYRNKIATSIEMTNELLAAGFFGFEPGILATMMNQNHALDRHKMRMALKQTQSTIGYHKREDEARRVMTDEKLQEKALAMRATDTIQDLNMEHMRQIVEGNNRSYTATMYKLGEARKQGNDAIIESLEYIMELDPKNDGKLFERIGALTISGLTIPPEQYEVINELSDVGFKCALELARLGVTIGDFRLFKRLEDDDEYEANLMVKIAAHEYTLKDTDGSGLKQMKGSDSLTAEVIARNTFTKEGLSARAVGGEEKFIEDNLNDYFNNYADRYTIREDEIGYALKRSENNVISQKELQRLDKINADSSEVSQITGRHKGLVGMAQSVADFAEDGIRYGINKQLDILEGTGNLLTGGKGGKYLGTKLRDLGHTGLRYIQDPKYRKQVRNRILEKLAVEVGFKVKNKVEDILGRNTELVVKDCIMNPKHILLYKDLLQNVVNGTVPLLDIADNIQLIIRGIDPTGQREVERINEEDIVTNTDGSLPGTGYNRHFDEEPTRRAFGTKFAGLGSKEISKYSAGTMFSSFKNAALGYFMGGGGDKKKDENKEEKFTDDQVDSTDTNKAIKSMSSIAAAVSATSLMNTNNSPLDSETMPSDNENEKWINTGKGLLKLVRSSVDGSWMVAPGKDNSETQENIKNDEERQERIARAIEEMNESFKGSFGSAGKKLAKKAGGGLWDLFKSVTSLPGDILSGLASALFAIPIIGGIAKAILSPIAGMFGKFKSAIFGTAENAAKGAGKAGAKTAGKLTSKLMGVLPTPARFILAALASLLGFSLIPSSAEASDDITYDENGNPIPISGGSGGSSSSSGSGQSKGIVDSALDFTADHTFEVGVGGLAGVGILANILSNRKTIDKSSTELAKMEEKLATLRNKPGSEKFVQQLETKIANTRTALADAQLNTPLAKIEKFLPNPATWAKNNPRMAILALAATGALGYGAKTIYDDSDFAKYGSFKKDVFNLEEHEYDPTKHGFKAHFRHELQVKADKLKREGNSDEYITKLFKDYEKDYGNDIYEHYTKNDARVDEAKNTAEWAWDKATAVPKSLAISNMYDYAIRALTNTQLGGVKHSIYSGTAKTVGDILVGNKELNADTAGELAWNIGYTGVSNKLVNMIWDASNASAQRQRTELIQLLRNNSSNPVIKEGMAAINAQFDDRIRQATQEGKSALVRILQRQKDSALENLAKDFAKQAGQELVSQSKGNILQRAIGKPIGAMKQFFGNTTVGKAIAIGGLGTYAYSSWNKAFATPEEQKQIAIQEKAEEDAKKKEEEEMKKLPRLKEGEKIVEYSGQNYIQLPDGRLTPISPEQKEQYEKAREWDREHGSGNLVDRAMSTVESIPGIGALLDRNFLAHYVTNKLITKNNRILGGGMARLAMDAASGKEIDAERVYDEMKTSAEFRAVEKVLGWVFSRQAGQTIREAAAQDISNLGKAVTSPWETLKETGRNLKDSANNIRKLPLLRNIPKFGIKSEASGSLDATLPKELTMADQFKLEEQRMKAYNEIERMKSYGMTEEQIKKTPEGKRQYAIIEEAETKLKEAGYKPELTEAQKEEIERNKRAQEFKRAQEERAKATKALEDARAKNAEIIKAREADKGKVSRDVESLSKEKGKLIQELQGINESKKAIEQEKSFTDKKAAIRELEEQRKAAQEELKRVQSEAASNRETLRSKFKDLTASQRQTELQHQQNRDTIVQEQQKRVNQLTEKIRLSNAAYQEELKARTRVIDSTLGTQEQQKRLAEVTKQLEERTKQLTQIEEQLKTQYAEREKLTPKQSEAAKAANEKAIKEYQAKREKLITSQNAPPKPTTTAPPRTVQEIFREAQTKAQTQPTKPSVTNRYSVSEIARIQIRENNLQTLRELPLDRREAAITERNSFLNAQIKELSKKGVDKLSEGERQQLKSFTDQIKDNTKLLSETQKDIKALENSQKVKPPSKPSLWERFTKSKVGSTISKVSKSGMFRSGAKVGLTTAVMMGVMGQKNALHEEKEFSEEEIMQRELAPGLSIIKDEKGNLVVVGKDGKPLADQSAVSRKQPIIQPGTDIIYDENGHPVLVDEITREPMPDQTPVTANQNATEVLHATRTAQMAAGFARAGVSAMTKFEKTKGIGQAIENKIAAANKAFFGKYADKDIKLMEKPKAFKETMLEVTKTLRESADKAAISKVSKDAAKETSTAAAKAERTAAAAAEENGKKKTILKKMREAIDKVIEQVTSSSLCPRKWVNSIKQMGVKLLELIAKPEIMQKLLRKLAQHTASMATGAVTFGIGTAVLTGVFAIEGFYSGFTEPETLLKIPAGKATTGMKVFCAIVRALEAFPYIGIAMMLLNESGYIVKALSAAGITDLFGFNEETLKSMRKEVKQDTKGNVTDKSDSSSPEDNKDESIFQKISNFFTFDPNKNKKNAENKPQDSSNPNNKPSDDSSPSPSPQEKSLWQSFKDFFTFNPNAGKQGKGYGKGKYVQQTDSDVARIPIMSGGKYDPSMNGKSAGCQITAAQNAFRALGMGMSAHAADMQFASRAGLFPNFNDGSVPQTSVLLAHRHGLAAKNVDAKAGIKMLDDNTSMVAQVSSSKLNAPTRRAMGFPDGDYEHYITLKKGTGGISFIDPDDPSGVGREKHLPLSAINALSNATAIRRPTFGRGIIEEEHLMERANRIDWTKTPYTQPNFNEETVQVIRSKIEQAEQEQNLPVYGTGTIEDEKLKERADKIDWTKIPYSKPDFDNESIQVIREKVQTAENTTNNYTNTTNTTINHPTRLVPQYNTIINNYGTSVINNERDQNIQSFSIKPTRIPKKRTYAISTPTIKYGMGKQVEIDDEEAEDYGKGNFFSDLWDGIKQVGKQVWDTVRAPFVQAFNIPSKTIKPANQQAQPIQEKKDKPSTTLTDIKAPNGQLVTKNDYDYLKKVNPNWDEEAIRNILFSSDKYRDTSKDNTNEELTDIQAPNGKMVTKNDYEYLKKTNPTWDEQAIRDVLFKSDKYKKTDKSQTSTTPQQNKTKKEQPPKQQESKQPTAKPTPPPYTPKPSFIDANRRAQMNQDRRKLIESMDIDPVKNHHVAVPKSDVGTIVTNTINKHKPSTPTQSTQDQFKRLQEQGGHARFGQGIYGRLLMPMTQTQFEQAHNARAAGVDKDKVKPVELSNPNAKAEETPTEEQEATVTSTPEAPIDPQAPPNLPYFKMWDDRWANTVYPGGSEDIIAMCGCGPTSLAMVATWATGQPHYPDKVAEWLGTHGQHVTGGTADSAYSKYAKEYGFDFKQTTSWDEAQKALKAKKPVINSQGPGLFTNNGHMITLAGMRDNGSVIVYNPSKEDNENSTVRFAVEEITNTSANGYFIPEGANIGKSNAVATNSSSTSSPGGDALGSSGLTEEQMSRKINQTLEMIQGKRAWGAFDDDLVGGSSNQTTPNTPSSNSSSTDLPKVNSNASTDEIQKVIWDHLAPKYGKTAAAAIMGNMEAESSFDPTVVNEIGATGLCQWYDSRERALKSYAASQGKDWTDVGVQLGYLDTEIESGYKDLVSRMNNSSLEDAAVDWEQTFEVSGDTASYPRRIQSTKDVFAKFGASQHGKGFFSDLWKGIKKTGKRIWDTVRTPFVQALNIPSKTIKPIEQQQTEQNTPQVTEEPVTDIKAPNGKMVTKNDYDYLINQGFNRDQAISMLFDHEKYKEVKEVQETASQAKISTKKPEPQIDELTNLRAPNGRFVTKNDLAAFTNQGLSLEAAKQKLFNTDKYKQKLVQIITDKKLGMGLKDNELPVEPYDIYKSPQYGKAAYQQSSIEELKQAATTIDWNNIEEYNQPDWENDSISVLRAKLAKASKEDDTYIGAIPFGKGNTMSVIGQLGPTCTIHSAKNILRAYTGKEPDIDPEDTSWFGSWYNTVKSELQTDVKEYSKEQRADFERDVMTHFAAKPNNPILLYQTGGAGSGGSHPINRVSGNHATIIGRKLADGKYEDYDSNGPTIHQLPLTQLFDDTAVGSANNNTDYNSGNILMIPKIDPSAPIDHWQSGANSAEPGAAPQSTTDGGAKPSKKSTGIFGIIQSLLEMMNIYGGPTSLVNKAGNLINGNSDSSTPGGASGDQMSEEQIWDWFRSKGYNENATAGIMGRLKQETSGYSPKWHPLQRSESGYEVGGMGLFQWTWDRGDKIDTEDPEPDLQRGRERFPTSRLANYLKWCDENGVPYESTSSQLNYLWEKDLNSKEHVTYTGYNFRPQEMNSMSAVDAAYHWTKNYERGSLGNESVYAKELLSKYKDRPAPTGKGFGKGVPLNITEDLTNLKTMEPIKAPKEVNSKADSFWSSIENSKSEIGKGFNENAIKFNRDKTEQNLSVYGTGIYGRQYPSSASIPTYTMNRGDSVTEEQIKKTINAHRSRPKPRTHYMSNKTEDGQRAWDMLSRQHGPTVAAVLMSNMGNSGYTTYGQTDGSWGVLNLPIQYKKDYNDYKERLGARDTAPDELTREINFLSSLIEGRFAPTIQQMKGQNVVTATSQWISNVEPNNTYQIEARQKRAQDIYKIYSGIGQAESLANMEHDAAQHDNSDALGDTVNEEAVEAAKNAQAGITTPTDMNVTGSPTISTSNSGGLVGGIFDSVGNFFTGVRKAFNKFSSVIGNTVMQSPLGSIMKKLFGDNALSRFFFGNAMQSGSSSPTNNANTPPNASNTTSTGNIDPNATVVQAPTSGSAGEAMIKMLNETPDVVTSPYGPRGDRIHAGVDYGIPVGTPLPATVDGTIDGIGEEGGYGNYVVIKDKKGYYHIYGHLSDNNKVKQGQQVIAGTIVAISGNTGRGSGPHLHYGIYDPQHPGCSSYPGSVDPMKYSISGLASTAPTNGKGYGKGFYKIHVKGRTTGTDDYDFSEFSDITSTITDKRRFFNVESYKGSASNIILGNEPLTTQQNKYVYQRDWLSKNDKNFSFEMPDFASRPIMNTIDEESRKIQSTDIDNMNNEALKVYAKSLNLEGVPIYNHPDLDNDSIDIIREKCKTIANMNEKSNLYGKAKYGGYVPIDYSQYRYKMNRGDEVSKEEIEHIKEIHRKAHTPKSSTVHNTMNKGFKKPVFTDPRIVNTPVYNTPTSTVSPSGIPNYKATSVEEIKKQIDENRVKREKELEEINKMFSPQPTHQETESISSQEHNIPPKQIWDFFQSRGLTPLQTAGAMGNIDVESMNFMPHVWECNQKEYPSISAALKATKDHPDTVKYGDGWGYGFAQWSSWNGNPRRDNLVKFAKLQGKSEGDWRTQLDFLLKEISEGEYASNQTWNAIDKVSTPEEAADIFCDYVEAPNPEYAHKDWREASARQFYDQFASTVSSQMGKGIKDNIDTMSYPELKEKYGSLQSNDKDNEIDWSNNTLNVIKAKIKAIKKQQEYGTCNKFGRAEEEPVQHVEETPTPITDTIKRIREQPTKILGVTQSSLNTFQGGEYFNDNTKVSQKARLYLKGAATLEEVAKDIGFNEVPSDETPLNAEQQQALGYRNYNKVRTWSHYLLDSQLWDGVTDVDRWLGLDEEIELPAIEAKKEEAKPKKEEQSPNKQHSFLSNLFKGIWDTIRTPFVQAFNIPSKSIKPLQTPENTPTISTIAEQHSEALTDIKAPNGQYVTQNDYDYLKKNNPTWGDKAIQDVLFTSDKYKEVKKPKQQQRSITSKPPKQKQLVSNKPQLPIKPITIGSGNMQITIDPLTTPNCWGFGKGIIEDEKLKERADKIDWTKTVYDSPNFEEETVSVIRNKIEQAEKEQNLTNDKVISQAQTTADQIQEAKEKTEKLNQLIESSTKPAAEDKKPKQQTEEAMNNFIARQKQSQDNMIQQAAQQSPSPLVDSEQVKQLIQEQQKTNSLLEQLIQAIMTSGQSIQDSIMKGASTSSQDPFSVANAISSPRQQQGSQYGMGPLPMNQNRGNILSFLNNARDARR